MSERIINARALQCPGPIMELFKASKTMQPGDVVIIEVTDVGFKKDIEAWCKKTGNKLQELVEEGGVIKATVVKG